MKILAYTNRRKKMKIKSSIETGVILEVGDSVVLIKDLKVKGSKYGMG
jgi:uncharacterized Zn ribbon protein